MTWMLNICPGMCALEKSGACQEYNTLGWLVESATKLSLVNAGRKVGKQMGMHITAFLSKLFTSSEKAFLQQHIFFLETVWALKTWAVGGGGKVDGSPGALCSQQEEASFSELKVNTLVSPRPHPLPVTLSRCHSACTQTNRLTWPVCLTLDRPKIKSGY